MLRRGLVAGGVLTLVWWVLAGTLTRGLPAGLLGVAFGVWLYVSLDDRDERGGGFRPLGLAGFLPYFAWRSVQGGWDVSRRALSPSMPLNPTLLHHELSLPPGPSRVFFTNALSLMPGTVGADLREDSLVVHLLVGGPGAEHRVRHLEAKVGRLFGVDEP